jgi:Trk K+ transport system NAD-binding subunit
MPGLRGDPSVPKTLLDAGLRHSKCRAVVALTSDEEINLKIAIMVRLLNPAVQVICRSTSHVHEEDLRSLGKVTVVDPFEAFANGLCTAIHAPRLHTLDEWLVGAHGVKLDHPLRCPMGTWILCGYGRMGKRVYTSMHTRRIPTVVIDPHIEAIDTIDNKIVAYANRKSLIEAGVEQAAGIVVATENDPANLKILLTARTLNPKIFIVIRQNFHENEIAFQAGRADLIMQPSLVTARKIMLSLISPLTQSLLNRLQSDPALLDRVYSELSKVLADSKPYLWTVDISENKACAICSQLDDIPAITLADLLRHPSERDDNLDCVPLVIRRYEQDKIMPKSAKTRIQSGDQILFCGTKQSQLLLEAVMNNPYTLDYLVSGYVRPAGYVMKWLSGRIKIGQPPASRQM